MKMSVIVTGAVIGLVLVAFCSVMSSKNGAISLEEQVNAAVSAIDVHLNNRYNKLHELAACVKRYDKHEADVIEKAIAARGRNMSGKQANEVLMQVAAVAEQYPDLKSQKNYAHLMNDISVTENHLAQVMKGCNETIRDYRYYCRKFPTSMFLSVTGYTPKHFDMYVAEGPARENKQLDLF